MAKRKFLVTARVQNPKGEWLQPGDEITLEADEKGVPVSRLYHNRVQAAGRRSEATDGAAEAQKVVKDAEDQAKAIIVEAQEKAEAIVKEAQDTAESLVAEALQGKDGKK